MLTIGLGTPPLHRSCADDLQNAGSGKTTTATDSTPDKASAPSITRADLAAAYLRLEQAFFAHRPADERVAKINEAFDQATRAFFIGSNAEAIRTIDALTGSLATKKLSPAERALVSLKVIVKPPVWMSGHPVQAECRVASIYEWLSAEPIESNLQLRVVNARGQTVLDRPLAVTIGKGCAVDARLRLDVASDQLAPGLYRIELGPADGRALQVGRVSVIGGVSLDEQRVASEKRLSMMESPSPQMAQALASCRARNHLLNNNPSEENSVQFLSDLNALACDVESEIQALASGKDPYFRRRGDYWRVFQVGKREIPLRVYAPEAAVKGTPVPLLVALHGMGGDENMFLEAYGAGIIKQIADKKGLLIASPLAYNFGSDVKALHALIEALGYDYAIDQEQVYVLGHSMGAGTATGLAHGHSDTVAAACCIAGGRFQAMPGSPPILVVSPELDGIVPPNRLQESAEKAIAAGMLGELRIMPGYGHTLAVGAILPEAVDWLIKHKRARADARY